MIESGRMRVGRACVVSGALASELLLGGIVTQPGCLQGIPNKNCTSLWGVLLWSIKDLYVRDLSKLGP